VRYSHVCFSRFYEPGARLAIARPTTPSKPNAPMSDRSGAGVRARVMIPSRVDAEPTATRHQELQTTCQMSPPDSGCS
jgi:hypothetical protein